MPILKPRDDEEETEFIERCMSNDIMQEEYPDNDQRLAICYTSWREAREGKLMERKAIEIELKADKEGSFTARIATLNVVDGDGDITLPGAFPEGKEVLVSAYQHGSWMGALPVGKAIIKETDEQVLAEGEFNLKTQGGRDHYEAVKFSMQLQEWSYGFEILEAEDGDYEGSKVRYLKKVEPFEISPVLLGSGVDTGTLAIKSQKKGTISYGAAHPDGTPKAPEDTDWDASKEIREAEVDDLKVMCTWVDTEHADTKQGYKLPHHKADGKHAVVWKAVAAAMAALLGARGGVDIAAGDKKGVYAHLKKHYQEFDKEPPEFNSLELEGTTYLNQAEATLDVVNSLIGRTKSLADLRRKEGRVLSSSNRQRIKHLLDALTSVASDLKELLDATEPSDDKNLRLWLLGLKAKVLFTEGTLTNEQDTKTS